MEPRQPPSFRGAALRLILPAALAVALFAGAVFAILLPATESALMERKRELIRSIVAAAHHELERHHARELAGEVTAAQAQAQALAELRALRYGEAGKDYLWVIDGHPRMLAHPYRPELEGRDVREYADAGGKRLFAEAVRAVAGGGEGYVDYLWQWQDDPGRVVPKLSYVRAFRPWGWIVGSGIYLDDVHAEIRAATGRLWWTAAGVAAVVAGLLAAVIAQGWRSEVRRRRAEEELARSHARVEALAQAADDAVWLVIDGRIAAANRRAEILLAGGAGTRAGDPVDALFADPADRILVAGGAAGPRTAMLATAAGPVPALVGADPVSVHGQSALVVTARDLRDGAGDPGERDRRVAAEAQIDAVAAAQAGLLAPALPLAEDVPILPLTATPAEVIARLAGSGGSAALLTAPDGGIAGLVTAGDLARRGGATAYAAMSAPVRRLDGGASVAAAVDAMAEARVGRLVLDGADGAPRLLTAARLLGALRQGPGQLCAATAGADQAALAGINRRLAAWMASLARVRLDPEFAAAEGTRVADAVLARCLALALAELGDPPAPCALLAVGSQGRGELLPGGDQDNALVFADGADPRWFAALARNATARYHAAGWPLCHGGCHAGDGRWCLPLAEWKARYAGWIRHGEPKALLEAAIFFDARRVWGDAGLCLDLAAAVRAEVAARPVFLVQLARETLQARSPLGLFGGIRPDDARQGTTDLKLAMLHFAGFARVQAYAHGIAATGTGARLRALAAAGHLPADTVGEACDAWRFLLALRLGTRTRPGGGDHIDPDALGAWDRAQLKRALAAIEALRERLRTDLARIGPTL